jgi:cytochrome c-type biogenesis protein CcmH
MAELPADDRRRAALQGAIDEVVQPAPQAPASGGDALAAIRGMVASLAARLEAQPDDPEGWVRLVRSYAVLGDSLRRDAALAKAQARYAGRKDVLDQLGAAAKAEPMK